MAGILYCFVALLVCCVGATDGLGCVSAGLKWFEVMMGCGIVGEEGITQIAVAVTAEKDERRATRGAGNVWLAGALFFALRVCVVGSIKHPDWPRETCFKQGAAVSLP
jgi:hypothetical protein